MIQTFKFNKAEISFENDKIIISDDAKQQLRRTQFTSAIWVFYGTLSILRYMNTGDRFLLWSGLIIGLGHLVVFVMILFRSTQSEIPFDEVKSIKVKKRFNNSSLDIRLKTNRLRRILKIDETDELKKYIETRFHSSTTV
ncbi:MAG: hypothetical protein KA270_16520 [Saprospiraceae bacterium]|nr:hypothetical protein [Saprospiraceae bacterium]MBP6568779.1 hypothetical protein [Saprospiraceae bacterium]